MLKKYFDTLLLIILLVLSCQFSDAKAEEKDFTFGRFGNIKTYQKSDHPAHVVLFISGDGGWNLGVVDMARALADLDALVVGVDIVHYFKQLRASNEKCVYPASDFEALSKFIQRKLNYSAYTRPIIVGYSSGATLAYVVAAQAPPNTFSGAISLGFCSDLEVTNPFCGGQGLQSKLLPKHDGWDFQPEAKLKTPWIVLHGTVDQVCDLKATQKFVDQVPIAKLSVLQKVGHGFSVQANWMPQFIAAFKEINSHEGLIKKVESADVNDLPLVEVPAQGAVQDFFSIIISGDGGWAGIDKDLADEFSRKGIAVVGLSSLEYFWSAKTPEKSAADLGRIIRHYSQSLHLNKVLLAGYSLGAEVLPFMIKGLPIEVRSQIFSVALINPGTTADFSFHLSDWIVDSSEKSASRI